ncbi:hypothetical protein PJF56_05270 [Roseofilum sp. BLCC_M91]|uniref:Uncharacterized protein n=1 Tax=Roseofilum halophilum BLCC-M91 TaxID=3022259 RepID=A0ABT7BGR8_9CYAN|nr:hypothetical protein [Roseofilum halophilum]MDJ1178265.1 hypothetical protein [Roseofilum halophilum BLCC-M91]
MTKILIVIGYSRLGSGKKGGDARGIVEAIAPRLNRLPHKS